MVFCEDTVLKLGLSFLIDFFEISCKVVDYRNFC